VIDGLPPGPIANPGRARSKPPPIRRAPRSSTSSPTAPAASTFADTYDQHQRNVTKLRGIEQQATATAPPARGTSGGSPLERRALKPVSLSELMN
jgi:UPF0755 protein